MLVGFDSDLIILNCSSQIRGRFLPIKIKGETTTYIILPCDKNRKIFLINFFSIESLRVNQICKWNFT